MTAIDRLLEALDRHEMEQLVLEPGQPPRLLRQGRSFRVARNELSAEAVRQIVREVAPEGVTPAAAHPWRIEHRYAGRRFFIEGPGAPGGGGVRVRPADPKPDPAAGGEAPAVAPGSPAQAPASDGADPGDDARRDDDSGPAAPPPANLPGSPHPAVRDLRSLLCQLAETGGSDLHLSSNRAPRVRLDGHLVPLDYAPPGDRHLEELLLAATPAAPRERFLASGDVDFGLEIAGHGRFRANLFRDREGIGGVFRRIPLEIPTAEDLALPPGLRELAELGKGLVLVTGPTGSGKSTTLAALLDLINRRRKEHILTIEDPIEFVHTSRGCLVNQREVGSHTGSFATALRAALREDPDVVLVGEMRDLETTSIAVETAETGHLVFGTLHTTSAAATVERMIDQYPQGQQAQIRLMLASTLRAAVSQVLLPRKGGGRVAAFELLRVTPAVSNLIREGKAFQIPSMMQTGRANGMMLLDDSLFALVESEVVEAEQALARANERQELARRLRTAGLLDERRSAEAAEDEPETTRLRRVG